jgi:tol-pal system protein YbgF
MKHCSFVLALVLAFGAAVTVPASAANKEQLQMMADIRMLQEQAQQLQVVLGALSEALKAVNARIDQQTETNRRAFAEQKLGADNLSNDLRIVREKMDDNNVRIGSLTQEIDAMRQSVQQLGAAPPAAPALAAATDPASVTSAPDPSSAPPPPAAPTAAGASPQKLYDSAWTDYTTGQYDLAVLGFESYIKSFPRSDLADDAQVYIGNSYLQAGKNEKAVEAYDLAIRTYPTGNLVPDAYYKKGTALLDLKQVDRAIEAFQFVAKTYPDSNAAILAKQQLSRLQKP